ncbi:hypothetical protein Lepto7376_4249 [[Leptolyngbya] sp. PCC 7376]|uniref:FcoT family thioesterase n=1 Tax=[Leptolyngbya] sp. PCC 7376 TaxID=111781 RepID=UPI00029F3775|nr:FcoT family thioesterase [[Leptolyngbya] sp. PCC 7376]AFY40360.1 hypothetical protein Lepto7376_4249 [[Leptolyngbya] sp. PCC 7376]
MKTKVSEKISPTLIQQILIPYESKNTAYLKAANIISRSSDLDQDQTKGSNDYVIQGDFEITESCYIDDTGHFNAVEFNICYNQIFYVAIANACFDQSFQYLRDMTLEEFYKKQLPNIYITRLESHYKKTISPKNFEGILSIKKARKIRDVIFFRTQIDFTDHNEGLAYGEVDVVIT